MAKNKKKQHSITTQITLTIVGLVAGTVLLCWLLNVTLLEGYYTRYKQEVLENGFQQINAASEQGILNTSDYDIDFEKICSNGNLTILIITSDGTVVRSSTNGVENLRMQFMEIIMASVQNDDMHLNMKVLKANDNYVMGEKEDTRLESDYLILWGTLADGNLLLARTPLESIKESAQVSNRLLMDVGVVAVIVSGIIIFFVIDFLTKDIIVSCVALNINSFLFVFLYDIKKSKKYLNKFQKIRWNKIFGLFKKGFSVFAFSFLAVYIVNVPKYVIDILLDNRFQTIFSIIVMPGTVMSLCGQYIMAPLLTNVVECYNQKKYKEFKNIIFKILGILVVLGIIVELGAATVGIPILGIVYAIDLNAYVLDLIIIIFGAILYAIAGVFSTALITMRRNGMQLIIYLIDAIFSVIISYLFISTFGIHGATIGYTSTMVLHVILYTIYFLYEYSKLVKSED